MSPRSSQTIYGTQWVSKFWNHLQSLIFFAIFNRAVSQPGREIVAQIQSHKAGSFKWKETSTTTSSLNMNYGSTANIMGGRQRYSHYLPLYQSLSRTTSRAASFSKDGTRSPRGGSKSGRPSSSLQSAKRRSTMNSRDAAYDEEEQLRRDIEASKGEKSGESTDGGTRRGKRGRSDSEE